MRKIVGEKLTRAEYDAIKAVRSTESKMAAKSMFHFNEYRKGNREVSPGKQKGWDLGTCGHSLCLENDISKIRIFDLLKPNGEEYASPRASKAFEEMVKTHPKQIVVTKEEFKTLCDKRNAFWASEKAREVMQGCQVEVTYCAQDPITGLWLKCQVDAVNLEEKRFADFKGCPDASEWGVGRMGAKAKWPIQIGHYAYVIELATGVKMERFDFIAQEFNAPHYTDAHELAQFDFENSRLNFREILNRLAVALEENVWPGYQKRGAFSFPPWAYEFEEINDEEWGAA